MHTFVLSVFVCGTVGLLLPWDFFEWQFYIFMLPWALVFGVLVTWFGSEYER